MGPFIVELFTFGDFARYPSQVKWLGNYCHQQSAPYTGKCSTDQSFTAVRSPWEDLQPSRIAHLLRNMTAPAILLDEVRQSLSASPLFQSPSGRIGSNVGITLKSNDWNTKPVDGMNQDYSDEPPSSKASYSRSTSLYRHSPQCAVNYIPLAVLVRHGLPGRLLPDGKSPILALPRRRHVKQSFTNHDPYHISLRCASFLFGSRHLSFPLGFEVGEKNGSMMASNPLFAA